MNPKHYKKIVEWNWKEPRDAIISWIFFFGTAHYVALWFGVLIIKFITLSLVLLFLLFIPIFARLTANVYYEEIK
ncbi:MAG: hypothetical protein AABY22_11335 [Nanoarchaeota archaeon]